MARATAGCAAVWQAATRARAGCAAVWRGAHRATAGCAALWESGVPVVSGCAATWDGGDRVRSGCAALWSGPGERLAVGCAAVWEHVDDPPTPPDPPPPAEQPDGVRVLADGVELDPVRISLTWSREQARIEAEIELPDEERWPLDRHRPATLELWGYAFALVVDGRARSERFGSHGWTLRLASPASTLDAPWAAPVEGELAGQASALAGRLAGDIPLEWVCVDWRIGPGRWIASRESPLALLQTLATAAGATLRSKPDGGLLVSPLYPVSPMDWPGEEPAAVLTATGEVIALDLSGEQRDGINAITVSDAGASDDDVRIEEDDETRTATSVELLVYQIPWRDALDLTHRGNPRYASLTPLGIEERIVEDEEVIINGGAGQTQHPVYAIVSAHYNWVNLGTPIYSEDGTIETPVKGESILILSYRTRCRRFLAREARQTDLLVVAEDEE